MGNEIATAKQPSLPGFAVDRSAAQVLDQFTVQMEFHVPVINRRPTAVEREILQKRLRQIVPVLEPYAVSKEHFEIVDDATNRPSVISASKLVERALSAFLTGYPSLQNADGAGLVTAYKHDLRKLPVFAILRAFDAIKEGRVYDIEAKTGRQIPISKDWPPSSARVYDVAVKEMHYPVMEQIKIERVLGATKTAVPEISDEQRRIEIPRVQRMHQEARRALAAGAALSVEDQEAEDKRRAAAERERADEHDRRLVAEWRGLGLEPLYAGDRPMAVATARKINPALFAK